MPTYSGVLPISPDDVASALVIPDEAILAFNEIIAAGGGVYVIIPQREVVALMVEKGLNREDIYARGWLNVEPLYRAKGWKVTFDKPGYNEFYEAHFIFSRG